MMLKLTALAMTLLLASCAPTTTLRTAVDRELANVANPSAVIAAELAFARMAREKGQWTAFREYAAEDAVMFVPQTVKAQEWLKGRADPAQAVQWQPHQVWMSCDGSLAVTQGAAQWPDGRSGRFMTVWERQRNGGYKWVIDEGDFVSAPLPAPDFIQTQVASCDPLPPIAQRVDSAGGVRTWKASADRTLHIGVRVDPWCGRVVEGSIFRGNSTDADPPGTIRGMEQVLYRNVPPPPSPSGIAPPQDCRA